jgi:hypothetical protein
MVHHVRSFLPGLGSLDPLMARFHPRTTRLPFWYEQIVPSQSYSPWFCYYIFTRTHTFIYTRGYHFILMDVSSIKQHRFSPINDMQNQPLPFATVATFNYREIYWLRWMPGTYDSIVTCLPSTKCKQILNANMHALEISQVISIMIFNELNSRWQWFMMRHWIGIVIFGLTSILRQGMSLAGLILLVKFNI